MEPESQGQKMRTIWLTIFFLVFIWSGIEPKDYFTWSLEVAPAVIGLLILIATYKNFPLTPLLYTLILKEDALWVKADLVLALKTPMYILVIATLVQFRPASLLRYTAISA